MCVCVRAYACLCAHVGTCRVQKNVRSSKAGGTGSCKLPGVGAGDSVDPLQEQAQLFTPELSLQPCFFLMASELVLSPHN